MKLIACLIYWPIRIIWLLMCSVAVACVAIVFGVIIWEAAKWVWFHARSHWFEIAVMASLVICGAVINASYEWAKRKLAKK